MLYGSYKNARNAAWQCLLDFDIRELPVKPSTIAKQLGIKIIKNSSINELSEGESGATYLINSKWYIVYNDTEPRQRSRFTVAHELGHILLGHIMCDKHYARTFDIVTGLVLRKCQLALNITLVLKRSVWVR